MFSASNGPQEQRGYEAHIRHINSGGDNHGRDIHRGCEDSKRSAKGDKGGDFDERDSHPQEDGRDHGSEGEDAIGPRTGEGRGKNDKKHEQHGQESRPGVKVKDHIPDDGIQSSGHPLHVNEDRGGINNEYDVQESKRTFHQVTGEFQEAEIGDDPPCKRSQ
ncbi:MAG: hypothetical protein NTY64_14935 [Deltaproteobacteria bacterium]|nr:hypothetical protein [Deltaproteobacteria bacterium]